MRSGLRLAGQVKTRRLTAALALLLLLLLLSACAPRGTYRNSLGGAYRFSGDSYTATDSAGNNSQGTYEIRNGEIVLTDAEGRVVTLPYDKDGKTLTIGGIAYRKD